MGLGRNTGEGVGSAVGANVGVAVGIGDGIGDGTGDGVRVGCRVGGVGGDGDGGSVPNMKLCGSCCVRLRSLCRSPKFKFAPFEPVAAGPGDAGVSRTCSASLRTPRLAMARMNECSLSHRRDPG